MLIVSAGEAGWVRSGVELPPLNNFSWTLLTASVAMASGCWDYSRTLRIVEPVAQYKGLITHHDRLCNLERDALIMIYLLIKSHSFVKRCDMVIFTSTSMLSGDQSKIE